MGVVAGLWLGYFGAVLQGRLGTPAPPPPPDPDQAILERVLDRLLDVTVPKVREESAEESPTTGHQAEYIPPDDDWAGAQDWTDGVMGMGDVGERPLVGRLAPGQGIPGIPVMDGQVDPVEMWRERGEAAFDEWARETTVRDGEELEAQWNAWVDPVEGV